MAGTMSEGSGRGRLCDETSGPHQHCQSTDVFSPGVSEWRCINLDEDDGEPPISPPYWDLDNECGPNPSDMYKKFTWQIDNFSQVMNKKEIRSKVFEIWGYQWYILIYPQGCDVNNYMSLFLCVANHEKLLPGWSHFAQFAVAVVNKETKRSKFSDTLHRFWKKEHDWGWKKFIELSKVLDGYISGDTLLIRTQVQIVRDRADRPFYCLDPWYRRALLPVYLSYVEQTFHRYVDEKQSFLVNLRENTSKWSSFYNFWKETNRYSRHLMLRVRSDIILKLLVRQFFVEKDVSSTLVMDCLHSGLMYVEDRENINSGMELHDSIVPLVHLENDMFVSVDDLEVLVVRAATEPLPPKGDIYGHCNRTQDGVVIKELSHSTMYYEERHLTQIGCRMIELFSVVHIINKIDVAYREAVAFRRQEELIREEEEALIAEADQRAKRGATEREKKSKKKQGKQKQKGRKGKDKGRVEKAKHAVQEFEKSSIPDETKENIEESEPGVEEMSDSSDILECTPEVHPLDSEDKVDSPVNSETAISEVHPFEEATDDGSGSIQSYSNRKDERPSPSVVDDSWSTYSTEPVHSTWNDPSEGEFLVKQKRQRSFNRSWSKRGEVASNETGWTNNNVVRRSEERTSYPMQQNYPSGSCKQEAVRQVLPEKMKRPYWRPVKVEEAVPGQSSTSLNDRKSEIKRFSESAGSSSSGEVPSAHLQQPIKKIDSATIMSSSSSEVPNLAGRAVPARSKVDAVPIVTPKPIENRKPIGNPTLQRVPIVSSSSTAACTTPSGPSPNAPIALPVKTTPLIPHSVSAAGRTVSVPISTRQSNVPRSYKNVIIGGSVSEPLVHQVNEPACVSSNPTFAVAEEFPHLDIINALFEDEHKIGIGMTSNFETFDSLQDYLNWQLRLSEPIGYSNETVPSCRFEQPQVYHGNDFDRYGSYGLMADPNLHRYGDRQIDGLASNQRQVIGGGRGGGSNVISPHMGMRSRMEWDSFPYRVPDYTNVACRADGYGSSIFEPDYTNVACRVDGYGSSIFEPSDRRWKHSG